MKNSERVPIIDFLRGISCIGILLYHVRVDLWVGWREIQNNPGEYSTFTKAVAWLSTPAPFMGYAILLFFLISGFCIHYPNTNFPRKLCWKTYFIRRFLRIYPTFFCAILTSAVLSYIFHSVWGDRDWNLNRIFAVLTLSQNYPPHIGQFLTNPSLWTIPLEFEFYILYPLVFFFLAKTKFLTLSIFAFIMSAFAVYLSKGGMPWLTFTALFFWPSWLLGAWVAQLYRAEKLARIKLPFYLISIALVLVLALISSHEKWQSWIQYSFWTAFYFLFLIVCLIRAEFIIGILGKKIFKSISWIGSISFSLYLIHFPFFKLFGYLHRSFWEEKPVNFLTTIFYLLPVVFIAWLFYKWIENPVHKWSKRITK